VHIARLASAAQKLTVAHTVLRQFPLSATASRYCNCVRFCTAEELWLYCWQQQTGQVWSSGETLLCGEATVCSLWIVDRWHCQQYKNTQCCTNAAVATVMSLTKTTRSYIFMWRDRYFCPILTNFNFLDRFFIKVPIWNLKEVLPVRGMVTQADRRTDRHNKTNRHFS
jgi:hypothetical protein